MSQQECTLSDELLAMIHKVLPDTFVRLWEIKICNKDLLPDGTCPDTIQCDVGVYYDSDRLANSLIFIASSGMNCLSLEEAQRQAVFEFLRMHQNNKESRPGRRFMR